MVAFNLLVEPFRRHPIELSEVRVEHDPMAANEENLSLHGFAQHQDLAPGRRGFRHFSLKGNP
jgi:hypothetical protein